jgi:hypothetical protein
MHNEVGLFAVITGTMATCGVTLTDAVRGQLPALLTVTLLNPVVVTDIEEVVSPPGDHKKEDPAALAESIYPIATASIALYPGIAGEFSAIRTSETLYVGEEKVIRFILAAGGPATAL